jgi:hypothetical protein
VKRWIPATLVGACVATLGIAVTQTAQAGETPTTPTTVVTEGIVRNGVENGCLLLSAAKETDEPYLLVGGDRTLVTPGATVRITGLLEPHLGGYCQQGVPLRVTSAELITTR